MFGKEKIKPARTISFTKSTGSAVDLNAVKDAGHLDLVKHAKSAGLSLTKRNLAGVRADVVMIVDHSGSMYDDYADGSVQLLVERSLGFALQVDHDGTVPVIPFDFIAKPAIDVTIHNYKGVVNDRVWQRGNMGSTNLAAALRLLIERAKVAQQPIFAMIATDGNPNSRSETTDVVCELARYPVFLKFLALKPVKFLSELDKLPASKRLIDNVNSKPSKDSNLNLLTCSDEEFNDALVDEWDTWIDAAKKAGILA